MKDLVLLHGWGMNAQIWQPLLPQLKDYRCHCLELPGHGSAPWSDEYTDLAAWTGFILQQAPSRAIWLGWSLGGLIAQYAWQQAPERIERCLIIASSPCFVQKKNWSAAIPAAIWRQFAQQLAQQPDKTIRRFLSLQVRGMPQASQLLKSLHQSRRPAVREALHIGLDILLQTDLRTGERPPLTWLLGAKDAIVPIALAEQLPPSDQIIIGERSSHLPFLSQPQLVLDWLQA